ncbi:MAG: type II toxin-antitoxin system HipA family toxin [Blastochloris viridis]|uniref:Type II toxin-antitoxin system HipA family toxin n=1 Tax=Blastochloris viridis TaxID=1079 RepID=A0A6N4RCG5_BLAVI|nr:MAG: type II toxin-antitoxin system HipA family toxin [Blastochloris viridis]
MSQNIPALDIYLGLSFVGKLFSDKATLSFAYDADYVRGPQAVKLSASLPLREEPFDHTVTAPYFSGLLPDEDVRRRVARYLRISEKNTFALLREIGGECSGAVSVYPEGVVPHAPSEQSYLVLEEDEADDILTSLDKRPLLVGEDDIRISGAGAQDKLMVAFVDGKMAIPKHNTPSTHIIKPPIRDLEGSVYNELFCMRLAQAVGLPVPHTEVYWVKDKPYYLVERYDRKKGPDGLVTRLHQEDFCQALHLPPEMKYEDEGGPTIVQCFKLLDGRIAEGVMAGANKLTLLRGMIFNFLIGNGDAHGKNFSLLYKGESEELAPFYDLLNTIVYHNAFKAKMAMKVSGKYKFREVRMDHWTRLAKTLGLREEFVAKQVHGLWNDVARSAPVLMSELNAKPETASPIYEKIVGSIARIHQQLDGESS